MRVLRWTEHIVLVTSTGSRVIWALLHALWVTLAK